MRMDWLKELFKSLPLEGISEILAKIVFLWIRLVDGVPESELPFLAYVGVSIAVLILLFFALRLVPKFLRGILWVIVASVLLTPAGTIDDSGGSAPAIIGVAHHLLMGRPEFAFSAFLPVLSTAIIMLVIGALLQMIYATIIIARANAKKA